MKKDYDYNNKNLSQYPSQYSNKFFEILPNIMYIL